jgi:hypothetical protein
LIKFKPKKAEMGIEMGKCLFKSQIEEQKSPKALDT